MSMTLSVHASFRNATRHFSQPTYLFLCLQHNRGTRFDLTNDPLGGLAITANSEVAGPTGGFAWMMQLNDGSPKNLRIDQIEVHPDSPLILALPYPTGTSFSITANAYQWCNQNDQYLSCQEIFTEVDSLAKVRFGQGNVYFLIQLQTYCMSESFNPPKHTWVILYIAQRLDGGYGLLTTPMQEAGALHRMLWIDSSSMG